MFTPSVFELKIKNLELKMMRNALIINKLIKKSINYQLSTIH
jgi:hypothetical protein